MFKTAFQQGRRRIKTGGVVFLTHPPPSCQGNSFTQVGYVEDFDEPRTKLEAVFNIRHTVRTILPKNLRLNISSCAARAS